VSPRPRLQLALDSFDLPTALRPLQEVAEYVDVIEVGTVLCLSEGMHAVRAVRALFPDKDILADVRIAEAGSVIAKMTFDAGANLVSVIGCATLPTFEAVVVEARRAGGEVQVELGADWSLEKAATLWNAGVTHAILHRSRDAEAVGCLEWAHGDLESIKLLADIGFQVTVTGGIGVDDIDTLAGYPVAIVIAGRSIVTAVDPRRAAADLVSALERGWPR
jgi:3-dehydro-L-gulonate-6-phosphate decarboxylase